MQVGLQIADIKLRSAYLSRKMQVGLQIADIKLRSAYLSRKMQVGLQIADIKLRSAYLPRKNASRFKDCCHVTQVSLSSQEKCK